jgi:hypothetical protein
MGAQSADARNQLKDLTFAAGKHNGARGERVPAVAAAWVSPLLATALATARGGFG